MFRPEMAERFLALFIDPEKAVTIVGDLAETSSLSVAAVLRIAGSTVWQQLAESPVSLTLFALTAFMSQFVVLLPTSMAVVWYSRDFHLGWDAVTLALRILFAVTQLFVGRELARRSPGREAAACLGLGILNVSAGLMGFHNISLNISIWQIPVVIGTVWQMRKRQMRQRQMRQRRLHCAQS